VTFDPFGDFDKRGYLRNVARAKDSKIVRQMEHSSFTTGLDAALAKLAAQKSLSDGAAQFSVVQHKELHKVALQALCRNRPRSAKNAGKEARRARLLRHMRVDECRAFSFHREGMIARPESERRVQ
jgi:hypothetical protein